LRSTKQIENIPLRKYKTKSYVLPTHLPSSSYKRTPFHDQFPVQNVVEYVTVSLWFPNLKDYSSYMDAGPHIGNSIRSVF